MTSRRNEGGKGRKAGEPIAAMGNAEAQSTEEKRRRKSGGRGRERYKNKCKHKGKNYRFGRTG